MPPFPAQYRAMADFIAPAGPRSALWQTVLTLVVTAVFAMLALVVFGFVSALVLGLRSQSDVAHLLVRPSPTGLVWMLFLFLPMAIGLILAVATVLRRGPRSLTGPLIPVAVNFLRVGVPILLLGLVLLPLTLSDPNVQRNLSLDRFLTFLPLAIPALLIQTGAEELFFRGFLQQQLAARFAAPLIWLGVPTVLFAYGHYAGGGLNLGQALILGWTALFGLAAADLTARTGNLGAAYGLHFANNALAVLMVAGLGPLGHLSLYNVDLGTDLSSTLPYLAVDTLTLFVNWLIARLVLRV